MDQSIKGAEGLIQYWVNDPNIVKIVVLVLGLLTVQGIIALFHRFLNRSRYGADSIRNLKKIVSSIGYVLMLFLLTSVYRDKLGGLTVALGVAGAGIAFALQEVIASLAGWVAILFGGFYRTGDRVLLGGIKGDVIEIGTLRTTLMELGDWVNGDLYNGRIVRVANSFVFKEPVFNYSGQFPFLWDEVTVPVRYGSDWRLAGQVLREAADKVVGDYSEGAANSWAEMVKSFAIENAVVEPMVTKVANDNWIEFTVRYVVNYKMRRGTKDLLFDAILDAFELHKDKISFASATFELVDAPSLRVVVDSPKG